MPAIPIVEGMLDGDIGGIFCGLVPFVLVVWLIIRVYILPARKWNPSKGQKERTYFYRKKQAEEENEPREPDEETRST